MTRLFKETIRRTLLLVSVVLIACLFWGCAGPQKDHFRFVFMTDIHLEPGKHAVEGFQAAIDKANSLKPDFVITGGDLVADAMNQTQGRADSLYSLYIETVKRFSIPVYNAIGNHEHFGIDSKGRIPTTHPDYGKRIFQNRLGQESPVRSFDHGNWHFILLDAIEPLLGGAGYFGRMDSIELAWLKHDLEKIGPERPVVLVTHIPLYSVHTQFMNGSLAANEGWLVASNSDAVWKICRPYNVRLVLQGHLHIVEEIVYKNTRFITGGAVSGAWWTGPHQEFPEGFLVVDVKGNDFTTQYQTFGWKAAP